jgi:predicted site-specific integrase-resolvase
MSKANPRWRPPGCAPRATDRVRFSGQPRDQCWPYTGRVPRTAILYVRSDRRERLDRQVRELEAWCDRAGVTPVETVAEVRSGLRASRRCREILEAVTAGAADLMLVRDVTRLSEDPGQLERILSQHKTRLAISRDDQRH